jgi:hypothetical protein
LGVDRYERLVTSFRGFFVGNSFMGWTYCQNMVLNINLLMSLVYSKGLFYDGLLTCDDSRPQCILGCFPTCLLEILFITNWTITCWRTRFPPKWVPKTLKKTVYPCTAWLDRDWFSRFDILKFLETVKSLVTLNFIFLLNKLNCFWMMQVC